MKCNLRLITNAYTHFHSFLFSKLLKIHQVTNPITNAFFYNFYNKFIRSINVHDFSKGNKQYNQISNNVLQLERLKRIQTNRIDNCTEILGCCQISSLKFDASNEKKNDAENQIKSLICIWSDYTSVY